MHIRPATATDLPALAEVFEQSVRAIAPSHYSPAQVDAWATTPQQGDRFPQLIQTAQTLVAEEGDRILGFAGLRADGYVTAVYVRGEVARRGIASQLMETLLAIALQNKLTSLRVEASEFSKPLFEKFGFAVYGQETVSRSGVLFQRYLMRRDLSLDARTD